MRATRRYGLTLAAILCCVLVPLTGCGSGTVRAAAANDPVAFSAAELASAAASVSAAPASPQATVVPTRPPGTHDADSAKATLRYFWAAYTYAYRTYDTAPLKSVSEQSCTVCSEVDADVGSVEAAGMQVQGYEVSVTRVSTHSASGAHAEVVATITRQPGQAVDASGQATELPGFAARRCTAELSWNGSAWVITKIVTAEA